MNKERRTKIERASNLLEQAKDMISEVSADEQYALDNIPENLQNSAKYSAMEDAIDALSDAESLIEEAREHLEDAIG